MLPTTGRVGGRGIGLSLFLDGMIENVSPCTLSQIVIARSASFPEASFRDGPKDQTRNLEIPRCAIAHLRFASRPGMTAPTSVAPE
jgi:hypothetical protein